MTITQPLVTKTPKALVRLFLGLDRLVYGVRCGSLTSSRPTKYLGTSTCCVGDKVGRLGEHAPFSLLLSPGQHPKEESSSLAPPSHLPDRGAKCQSWAPPPHGSSTPRLIAQCPSSSSGNQLPLHDDDIAARLCRTLPVHLRPIIYYSCLIVTISCQLRRCHLFSLSLFSFSFFIPLQQPSSPASRGPHSLVHILSSPLIILTNNLINNNTTTTTTTDPR